MLFIKLQKVNTKDQITETKKLDKISKGIQTKGNTEDNGELKSACFSQMVEDQWCQIYEKYTTPTEQSLGRKDTRKNGENVEDSNYKQVKKYGSLGDLSVQIKPRT